MATVPTYAVEVRVPEYEDPFILDVPTFAGPAVAVRRAHMTIVARGYGDLDTVTARLIAANPAPTQTRHYGTWRNDA